MIYDFICEACNERFTVEQSLEEYYKKEHSCPVCCSEEVSRELQVPTRVGSRGKGYAGETLTAEKYYARKAYESDT